MKKFYQCKSQEEQLAWIRERLEEGRTVSDPHLFLFSHGASVDPQKLIAKLRKQGVPIKTVYVKTTDAAGVEHPRTLAWRLDDNYCKKNP